MALEKSKYLQWFCGFYEGEGSVSNDMSNSNRLRLCIAQNDRTPLDIALKIWGGSVRERTRITPSGKVCHGHEWRIGHRDSLIFLNDIKPYMLIPYKISQLEKAIETSKVGLKRKFKCPACEQEYSSPSGRRRHVKAVHLSSVASSLEKLQDNQNAGNP